jgi:hypothetical protein
MLPMATLLKTTCAFVNSVNGNLFKEIPLCPWPEFFVCTSSSATNPAGIFGLQKALPGHHQPRRSTAHHEARDTRNLCCSIGFFNLLKTPRFPVGFRSSGAALAFPAL